MIFFQTYLEKKIPNDNTLNKYHTQFLSHLHICSSIPAPALNSFKQKLSYFSPQSNFPQKYFHIRSKPINFHDPPRQLPLIDTLSSVSIATACSKVTNYGSLPIQADSDRASVRS